MSLYSWHHTSEILKEVVLFLDEIDCVTSCISSLNQSKLDSLFNSLFLFIWSVVPEKQFLVSLLVTLEMTDDEIPALSL